MSSPSGAALEARVGQRCLGASGLARTGGLWLVVVERAAECAIWAWDEAQSETGWHRIPVSGATRSRACDLEMESVDATPSGRVVLGTDGGVIVSGRLADGHFLEEERGRADGLAANKGFEAVTATPVEGTYEQLGAAGRLRPYGLRQGRLVPLARSEGAVQIPTDLRGLRISGGASLGRGRLLLASGRSRQTQGRFGYALIGVDEQGEPGPSWRIDNPKQLNLEGLAASCEGIAWVVNDNCFRERQGRTTFMRIRLPRAILARVGCQTGPGTPPR